MKITKPLDRFTLIKKFAAKSVEFINVKDGWAIVPTEGGYFCCDVGLQLTLSINLKEIVSALPKIDRDFKLIKQSDNGIVFKSDSSQVSISCREFKQLNVPYIDSKGFTYNFTNDAKLIKKLKPFDLSVGISDNGFLFTDRKICVKSSNFNMPKASLSYNDFVKLEHLGDVNCSVTDDYISFTSDVFYFVTANCYEKDRVAIDKVSSLEINIVSCNETDFKPLLSFLKLKSSDFVKLTHDEVEFVDKKKDVSSKYRTSAFSYLDDSVISNLQYLTFTLTYCDNLIIDETKSLFKANSIKNNISLIFSGAK